MIIYQFIVAYALLQMSASYPSSAYVESDKVVFETHGCRICCDLYSPEGDGPHPAIIIVHGDGRGTRNYYRTARTSFLDAGYAVLIWDKPGFGESTGRFSADHVLSERADILIEAIVTLRSRPDIAPRRIGAWGVSQAGYVIPLAIQRGAEIAFVILVGAPAENSVQQTAYFVGQQVLCEGYSALEAAEADSLALGVLAAQTHREYANYGQLLLDRYPVVKTIGFMAGILPDDQWSPRARNSEAFFDPMTIMETLTIPALILYGELDKNVDPDQGAAAYQAILAQAGHPSSRVLVLQGVDHDMVPGKTGCMKERNARRSWTVSTDYLDAMYRWLIEIRNVPNNHKF